MPGLVPGIHVFGVSRQVRRGWPGQARPCRDQSPCPTIAQNAAKTDGIDGGRTREGGRDVVSNMITKITWQRAGQVTEPGRYMYRFGWLTVTAADLAIWKQYPEAAFTLVELP